MSLEAFCNSYFIMVVEITSKYTDNYLAALAQEKGSYTSQLRNTFKL
jgi:hypothetical protein